MKDYSMCNYRRSILSRVIAVRLSEYCDYSMRSNGLHDYFVSFINSALSEYCSLNPFC